MEKAGNDQQSPVEVSQVSTKDQAEKYDEEDGGKNGTDNEPDEFGDAFNDAVSRFDDGKSGDDDADDRDGDTAGSDEDEAAADDVDGDDKQHDDDKGKEGSASDDLDYKAELEKERNKTKSWEGRLSKAEREKQELKEELEALRTRQDQSAANGDTDSTGKSAPGDDEIDEAEQALEAFYDEFPSLREPLEIIQRKTVSKAVSEVTGKVNETIKPIVSRAAKDENDAHTAAIYKAHDDLDEITSSGHLDTWIDEQSPRIAKAYREIIADGSTKEVIEMLNDYKNDRGISDNDQRDDDTGDETRSRSEQTNRRRQQADDMEAVKGSKTRARPKGGKADMDDFDGAFDEAARRG